MKIKQKMKIKIYPCPKCKAVANIDPKATNLTCPQCGYCYKKSETMAYYDHLIVDC